MNNNIKYFSTGEFAKLCNVHKKTLFYYDEINLFKPEKVMPTGYRYYSEYQLETFNIIYTLKDIGMPLKEIKEYMDRRTPENMLELFEYETKEVEKEINKLKRKQEIMSNKIKLIKEANSIKTDILLEEQEEEYIILSDLIDKNKLNNLINKNEDAYDIDAYVNLLNLVNNNDLNFGHAGGSIKTKEDLHQSNNYSYYYIRVNKNCNYKNIIIKPNGTYLVGYLKGYYSKAPIIYKKLLQFIHENDLEIIGFAYEDVLIDQVCVKNPDDFVLKVSIQVEEKSIKAR